MNEFNENLGDRWELGLRRVGQLAPNAFGFFDIIGNAAEFVAPRRDRTPILKPDGTPFTNTAAIGGSYSWHPDDPRRGVKFIIDGAYGATGLRLARD